MVRRISIVLISGIEGGEGYSPIWLSIEHFDHHFLMLLLPYGVEHAPV